jgi:hypothetical protein
MARDESDREDLLREATALAERIELALDADGSCVTADVPEAPEHIVVGFRKNGAASFFFGADPVYQFNANGELRRAYRDGLLYKAVGGRLVALRRIRTANEVALERHELTEAEQREFLGALQQRLDRLALSLAGNDYRIVGQVPSDADVLGRARDWLAAQKSYRVAAKPNV